MQNQADSPLWSRSAAALIADMRRGALNARAVTDAFIARIEAENPRLNALVSERFAAARAEADALDAARSQGAAAGALFGLPMLVKDSIDVAGLPTTSGIIARKHAIAQADDPYVARMRREGAIVLGKTNVAQALLYLESDNPLHGRTCNPWNVERTSGGSSGGQAAMIAVGGMALGLGSDIGGSSRVPAAFCGVFGFKPSEGRMVDTGRVSVPFGQRAVPSQLGFFARTSDDIALGLSVCAGGDVLPHLSPPVPLSPYQAVDLKGLRVGFFDHDGDFAVSAAVKRAVAEAAAYLQKRGVTVERFSLPRVQEAAGLFFAALGADGLAGVEGLIQGGAKDPNIKLQATAAGARGALLALLRTFLKLSGRRRVAAIAANYGHQDAAHYWRVAEAISDYRAECLRALDGARIDALLSPATALAAPRHGAMQELVVLGAYTIIYNLLGYPAGVVPYRLVGRDEETSTPRGDEKMDQTAALSERGSAGLPVGVQIAARPWHDHVALALMRCLEDDVEAPIRAALAAASAGRD